MIVKKQTNNYSEKNAKQMFSVLIIFPLYDSKSVIVDIILSY